MTEARLPLWMERLEEQLKLPKEKEEKKKTVVEIDLTENTIHQHSFDL